MANISFTELGNPANLPIAVFFFLCLIVFGLIFVYKQNWLRAINKAREDAGIRHKIKASEAIDQLENKLLKVVGWLIILLGVCGLVWAIFF